MGARRGVRDRTGLDGQAVAAFLAARREDAAAVLRLHAREEAVDALPAPGVRQDSIRASPPQRQENERSCEAFLTCPQLWRALWTNHRAIASPPASEAGFAPSPMRRGDRGYVVRASSERRFRSCGEVDNPGGKSRRMPPPPGQSPSLTPPGAYSLAGPDYAVEMDAE